MRHTCLALLAAAGLLALTGCGGSSAGTSDASATVGRHHTKHTAAAKPSTSATSSAPATPSGPPSCRTRDLDIGITDGEGAAGSTYSRIVLTNTSDHTCRTGGFGGVSLVGGGNGSQIGAPADRSKSGQVKRLLLKPTAKAEATLQVANAENYPASKCRPAPAEGFRVYPPNETRSAYVESATTGCRNHAVHLLTLSPYALVG